MEISECLPAQVEPHEVLIKSVETTWEASGLKPAVLRHSIKQRTQCARRVPKFDISLPAVMAGS